MRYLFLLSLLLMANGVFAETVYIDDMLRVGVRAEPNSSQAPIKVLKTGAALEVLARSGDYLRVRTTDGVEGWINGRYASEAPPARLRIDAVEAELETLRGELESVREAHERLQRENRRLSSALQERVEESRGLQERLDRLQRKYREATEPRGWWWVAVVAVVGLFLLGFYLGAQWRKQQIATRLGGLEV